MTEPQVLHSDIINLAAGISAITPERLENLCAALRSVMHLPGDIAELGVWRGGSALVLAATCPAKLLHLFDTFSGLPADETAQRDQYGYVRKGMFSCPQWEVRIYLASCHVAFHQGVFPATTDRLDALRFCFVHVDCDLYQGAHDAIEWFWPRLSPGGIMFFDDYGCKFTGVTEAVREAFSPDRIVEQHEPSTGVQIGCYVVKELAE